MAFLTIKAVRSGTAEPLAEFAFLVNENNVRDPRDPDPSRWPSLSPGASHSPVAVTGDSGSATVEVPPGRYLVTVRAPGHKLGGEWVTVDGETDVTVALQPHPLPLSKIRVRVFHDNHPVNGEDDIPLEPGLEGFRVVLADTVGEVTVDYFGNVLSLFTDANGELVVENLAPGKYEVQAIPPDGTDWVQTTTIEGTHAIDAWIEEGNDGYLAEEGFQAPLVAIGFARPMQFPVPGPGQPVGVVTGRVIGIVEGRQENKVLPGQPVDRPWVALTDIGDTDQQVYLGRGETDGTFVIPNVPPGLYQLATWDDPLDFIISFRTVHMDPGQTVAMGDILIPRWFGRIEGTVFYDENENGLQDPGEPGIPFIEIGTRFKDGSIQYGTVTDGQGRFELPEVFELEAFTVAELGFARFATTGLTANPDAGTPGAQPVPYPPNLLMAIFTGAGSTNRIDWGMKQYPAAGQPNGGISGVVYYGVMRNETDPRFALAEDYEPGIPRVTVNLYRPEAGGGLTLLQSVQTDAWQHPAGCTTFDGSVDPNCIELPRLGNQIKPGLFDGGWAFTGLDAGDFVVEVVPPPGYKVLAEGAENTGEGDAFLLMHTTPPYVEPARDKKRITLQPEQNATTDFWLYTDVPVAGRMIGLVADDLNLETDPASPYYLEKKPLAYTPVGIRDYTGRLLRTVETDANGVFEVLLPSTYTANVPIPSGVAPGMYRVVGNDPGDPDRPNPGFNPLYQTLHLVFDVWPGKTTYADVAILPVGANPDEGGQVPGLAISPDTPQVWQVEPIWSRRGTRRTVTIRGAGFGTRPGRVKLGDRKLPVRTWTDATIVVEIPRNTDEGAHQLLVQAANRKVSPTGITFHLLGDDYEPDVVEVTPARGIQQAIDHADGEQTLIIVRPGTYRENIVLHKNVRLQGMGYKATVLNGAFFRQNEAAWRDLMSRVALDGPGDVPGGQAITVVARKGEFEEDDGFRPGVDGFTITGARGRAEAGGGILLNAHCNDFEISNNVIERNGGGLGGGITIGRPYRGDCHNHDVHIHHNRIVGNGGISLAGAIGIFNGAAGYTIEHNEIIGNYSAEYGGGISHLGYSPDGRIRHNRILYNEAFDEGGGILIGGEQPKPPAVLSVGSGNVRIFANLIQGNLSNDDGGGIRLLRAGRHRIRIEQNYVIGNVATDLGGGIALDDASAAEISRNTIAANVCTSTAEDSDGLPHGAGLVSEKHSLPFLQSLPSGAPPFSSPTLKRNLFWQNRAYHWDPVSGGLAPDYALIDLEVFGTLTPAFMAARRCYLTVPYAGGSRNTVHDGTNPPQFASEYLPVLKAFAMRGQPDFKVVRIIHAGPDVPGDYRQTEENGFGADEPV
ncbi:MAG TPA: NosD domain-containing protein [Symbiobacteriaceae bacterium]|nr:NosD domain-containing protein [Symbiobacteriaceae bacterium]